MALNTLCWRRHNVWFLFFANKMFSLTYSSVCIHINPISFIYKLWTPEYRRWLEKRRKENSFPPTWKANTSILFEKAHELHSVSWWIMFSQCRLRRDCPFSSQSWHHCQKSFGRMWSGLFLDSIRSTGLYICLLPVPKVLISVAL